jgi:hypothetical protein
MVPIGQNLGRGGRASLTATKNRSISPWRWRTDFALAKCGHFSSTAQLPPLKNVPRHFAKCRKTLLYARHHLRSPNDASRRHVGAIRFAEQVARDVNQSRQFLRKQVRWSFDFDRF